MQFQFRFCPRESICTDVNVQHDWGELEILPSNFLADIMELHAMASAFILFFQ
jgi:hypothetical protein